MRKECPIDIDDVVRLARKIHLNLILIKDTKELLQNVYQARTQLDVLIQSVLTKLHDPTVCMKKADEAVYLQIQLNLARIVGGLDEEENKKLSTARGKVEDADRVIILGYIRKLESVLYGSILHSIKQANVEAKGDPKVFLYVLLESLSIVAGTFGAPTREHKGSKGKMQMQPIPFSARDALKESGQKKLEKKFDDDLASLGEDVALDDDESSDEDAD